MRAGVRVGGGEVVGEVGGLHLVGDVGQRVPPPAAGSSTSCCGSKTQTGPAGRARVAGGVDDVALVRGRHHGAGCVEDRRDRPERWSCRSGARRCRGRSPPSPDRARAAGDGLADRQPGRGRRRAAGRSRWRRGARAPPDRGRGPCARPRGRPGAGVPLRRTQQQDATRSALARRAGRAARWCRGAATPGGRATRSPSSVTGGRGRGAAVERDGEVHGGREQRRGRRRRRPSDPRSRRLRVAAPAGARRFEVALTPRARSSGSSVAEAAAGVPALVGVVEPALDGGEGDVDRDARGGRRP